MNKELRGAIIKYNLHPVSYKKIGKVYLISDYHHEYIIKLNTNNYDIYKYLISRDFLLFPNYYNDMNDNYDILEYIEDLSLNREQKINDYINVLAILHFKTSYQREIDLDEIKEKYETITNRLVYLRDYYHELNNSIDREMFLSPSMYLLVRNISLIYSIINNSLSMLNKLYDKLKNEKSIRVSLLHNNVFLDHLLINNKVYLISWDKACFDSPIYELESFYRKYYHDVEIDDFIKSYEKINKLSVDEETLLLILLSIPKEIKLTNNTYLDTKLINDEINYLNKVYELQMLKKNTKETSKKH